MGTKTAPVRLSSDEDNSSVGGVAGYNGPGGSIDGGKAPETECYADITLEGRAQGNLGGIAGVNEARSPITRQRAASREHRPRDSRTASGE